MVNKKISVCHVTPEISKAGGGVATYVWDLAERALDYGINASVLGQDSLGDPSLLSANKNISVHILDRLGPRSMSYLPRLKNTIFKMKPDIIHAHGLRMWPIYGAMCVAKKNKMPFVLSMHGMMTPALLQQRKFKKQIAYQLFDRQTLKHTNLIHATSAMELEHIRNFGCKNPVIVLPIGCDIPQAPKASAINAWRDRFSELKNKRVLLYLSLIHHKKGLLRLIDTWAKLSEKYSDWHLLIAGPDHQNHLIQIKEAIRKTKTQKSITLAGPLYGAEKNIAYQQAQAFVLHSDWENFGIVIAEALAGGLPVITSDQTPWQIINQKKCGWWIPLKIEALEHTLAQALALSADALNQKGQNAIQLIKEDYAWPGVYEQLQSGYEWLLGNGPKPAAVDMI